MSGDIFECHNVGQSILLASKEARDVAKHPIV